MSFRWFLAVLIALAVVSSACAQPQADRPAAASTGGTKTLTFGGDREPAMILTRMGNNIPGPLRDMVHQHLSIYDSSRQVVPQLAVELPSQAKGSWVVRPDGTMQTTYRIHPNVTWHDGAPLSGRDFVFGWTIAMDPELPIESRILAREIERIDTPDDHTLVIEWKRLYATANVIMHDDLGPLPEHLLKRSYEANKQQFLNSPFWNREFVGVGPYRVVDWEAGSHINLEAYDGFHRGKARIDRITIRFLASADSLTAAYLNGDADFLSGRSSLKIAHLRQLLAQWQEAGFKPAVIPNGIGLSRHIWVQERNPGDPALQDARVRQGLVHALDRQTLADALFPGEVGVVGDTILFPPDDPRWEWVKDVNVKYPFDRRRAEELFVEAGLRRGPAGFFLNLTGAKLEIDQLVNPFGAAPPEQEGAITSDMWKSFGLQTNVRMLSQAQEGDRQITSTFPGLYHTSLPRFNPDNYETRFHSASCPTQENGWSGQNHGCYRNPAVERVIATLKSAIEPEEQRPAYRELAALTSLELPVLPELFVPPDFTLVRPGITGVTGTPLPEGSYTWNVAEWDLDSELRDRAKVVLRAPS